MNDFLNSKFVSDLKEGKLPAVQVDNVTIVKLGVMEVVVIIIAFLLWAILKEA